ncbi:DUF222 domain-containing protein [Rhodococcus koreensis]|uniref:DUF222 domain-containing protein n=1 Tax=Rhodococcus koreensis TaxID=99653 RepID=UPI00366F760E
MSFDWGVGGEHLSMLAAAVDGLLDAGLTELSDGEVVEVMRGVEQSLRRTEAVSHRLVVETVERSVPASLGYTSPKKLLIEALRISGADASARVTAARELGCGTPWRAIRCHPSCRKPLRHRVMATSERIMCGRSRK